MKSATKINKSEIKIKQIQKEETTVVRRITVLQLLAGHTRIQAGCD